MHCVYQGKKNEYSRTREVEKKKEELSTVSQEQWAKKSKKAEVTAEGSAHTWLNTCPRGKNGRESTVSLCLPSPVDFRV